MNVKGFLETELGLDLRKEQGQWRTRCHKCQKIDGLSVDDDTGRFKCWGCSCSGNAYVLMKECTPYNNDEIWSRLKQYGLDTSSESPQKRKEATASIKPDGYRRATEDELAQLAASKGVTVNALSKLGVLVDRKKPEIAVLPMHRKDLGNPVGGIRVRLDGEPCWYIDPDGKIVNVDGPGHKPVKYPMIKDGLVGLLGSKWLKSEDCNTIILCEGFRDMLAVIEAGYVGTTFGGCGSFSEDCAWQFNGRHVIICFDCDKAGVHHAPRQAERLYLNASDVEIVPAWTEIKEKGGVDLFDHLTERE